MGDPHRKDRYGEVWPQGRIDAYIVALKPLRTHVTLSGGWAWHFMSPVGHKELKHAHDHKDVDLFVAKDPTAIGTVMGLLTEQEFKRVPCRWTNKEFHRWEKTTDEGWKLTIDFFIGNPSSLETNGWWVVPPEDLLPMYSNKHQSRECFSVNAARKLLAAGIDPVGRPELVEIPHD